MKMVLLKTTARGQERVIFIRLNQGQNLGVQSLDLITYHTARPQKIGAREEENKRASCKDRQNQPLIELYLIVHCPMHLCRFPPLAKFPAS